MKKLLVWYVVMQCSVALGSDSLSSVKRVEKVDVHEVAMTEQRSTVVPTSVGGEFDADESAFFQYYDELPDAQRISLIEKAAAKFSLNQRFKLAVPMIITAMHNNALNLPDLSETSLTTMSTHFGRLDNEIRSEQQRRMKEKKACCCVIL